MGYACPVCEAPQADAGHLANHLAFTAILGDDAHEAWLDEHAPGWGELGESELAERLVDEVEETEFPQVFEDTVGGLADSDAEPASERSGALFDDDGHGHHHHGHDHDHPEGGPRPPTDPETEAILEEAREMTREMLGVEGADDGSGDEAGDGPDGGPTEETSEGDRDGAADDDGEGESE